ncbi:MAG: hypothetical protein ACOYXT_13320 [Bacteroidota bacterium]
MKKYLIIIAFVVLATGVAPAQTSVTNPPAAWLEWNEFYKLSWHDFQGKPGDESVGDAGTFIRIKAKPFFVKKKVQYNVLVYFVKDKSWKRDPSPALLAHEQLHFDMAELYARKIRKKIMEMSNSGVNDVRQYNVEIQQLLDDSNFEHLNFEHLNFEHLNLEHLNLEL